MDNLKITFYALFFSDLYTINNIIMTISIGKEKTNFINPHNNDIIVIINPIPIATPAIGNIITPKTANKATKNITMKVIPNNISKSYLPFLILC